MDKAERDAIEARLPPDRDFRMPAAMTNKMRGAAYDAFCTAYRTSGSKIDWNHICQIFVAAFDHAPRD